MSGEVQPLCEAIENADLRTVDALIRTGVDVNATDTSGLAPLSLAIEHANLEIVRRLIACGVNVNRVDDQGWTPVMHAIDVECDAASQTDRRSIELTEVLLVAGANPTPEAFALAGRYENQDVLGLLRRFAGAA